MSAGLAAASPTQDEWSVAGGALLVHTGGSTAGGSGAAALSTADGKESGSLLLGTGDALGGSGALSGSVRIAVAGSQASAAGSLSFAAGAGGALLGGAVPCCGR